MLKENRRYQRNFKTLDSSERLRRLLGFGKHYYQLSFRKMEGKDTDGFSWLTGDEV